MVIKGLVCNYSISLEMILGNYYQQGDVRREELIKSASMLGLHSSDVVLINDRELPDSPSVEWNEDIIGNHILEAIEQHGIETVRTGLGSVSNSIHLFQTPMYLF